MYGVCVYNTFNIDALYYIWQMYVSWQCACFSDVALSSYDKVTVHECVSAFTIQMRIVTACAMDSNHNPAHSGFFYKGSTLPQS